MFSGRVQDTFLSIAFRPSMKLLFLKIQGCPSWRTPPCCYSSNGWVQAGQYTNYSAALRWQHIFVTVLFCFLP